MKKIVVILILVCTTLAFTGCGGNSLTLDNFISAYQTEGFEVDVNEKPMFDTIGAVDGVIFYIDDQKVAIYEYDSDKDLTDSEFNFDSVNGKFGLESSNEQAKTIFDSVK